LHCRDYIRGTRGVEFGDYPIAAATAQIYLLADGRTRGLNPRNLRELEL